VIVIDRPRTSPFAPSLCPPAKFFERRQSPEYVALPPIRREKETSSLRSRSSMPPRSFAGNAGVSTTVVGTNTPHEGTLLA